MKIEMVEHPAVKFGGWLRERRRASGVVARVFAGRIDLSPAEYAEVESGIIHWIGQKQENLIELLLDLDEQGTAEFRDHLSQARECPELEFGDVYGEEELAPARCCTLNGEQITESARKEIIRAVFTPLPR